MAVAAARHHKPLASIVHYLGLTFLYVGFGSCLVAHIDVLAILHGESFCQLTTLGGEDFTIDHEIGTGVVLATGKHTHTDDSSHHYDTR